MSSTSGRSAEAASHWDDVYRRHDVDELSWFRSEPAISVELIGRWAPDQNAAIIDVGAGAGASTLVDRILVAGHRDITLLDVSTEALSVSRERLAESPVEPASGAVEWVCTDLLEWSPPRSYDLWHDRAVFHFLTDGADQHAYRDLLGAAVAPGGHAIVATFAEDGPERCSGLPTARYSPSDLAAAMGPGFQLVDQRREEHLTPAGVVQPFTWVVLCAHQVPGSRPV